MTDKERRVVAAALLAGYVGAELSRLERARHRRRKLENIPVIGDILWALK